jgi:predicted ATPase
MSSPIIYKKFEIQTVPCYNNKGILLGNINELELIHIRLQIAKNKISGYFLEFNKERIQILTTGKLEYWPNGLFDEHAELLAELFKIQIKNNY